MSFATRNAQNEERRNKYFPNNEFSVAYLCRIIVTFNANEILSIIFIIERWQQCYDSVIDTCTTHVKPKRIHSPKSVYIYCSPLPNQPTTPSFRESFEQETIIHIGWLIDR